MATANSLRESVQCPHCGAVESRHIEMFAGFGNLIEYSVGDLLVWVEGKSPKNGGRPAGGNADAEGYAECEQCGRDFFLTVRVRGDRIEGVVVDFEKRGYK